MEVQEMQNNQVETDFIQNKMTELLENGYILLEDVIDTNLLANLKNCICDKLVKLGASKGLNFAAQYKELSKNIHPYEINRLLMREVVCSEFPKRILNMPTILQTFMNIIGVDLAYEITSELPVNVKDETNDSLIKKFHQEFWSGAGYRNYSF